MIFNDNDRQRINITTQASIDTTNATLTLAIDNTEYPCEWTAPARQEGAVWVREGRTTVWFAGPRVPPGKVAGAVVLSAGRHRAELIVEAGGTIVAAGVSDITVATS